MPIGLQLDRALAASGRMNGRMAETKLPKVNTTATPAPVNFPSKATPSLAKGRCKKPLRFPRSRRTFKPSMQKFLNDKRFAGQAGTSRVGIENSVGISLQTKPLLIVPLAAD